MENAYVYLAKYRRLARLAGKSAEQIEAVLNKAMAGDYDNLVEVIYYELAKLNRE